MTAVDTSEAIHREEKDSEDLKAQGFYTTVQKWKARSYDEVDAIVSSGRAVIYSPRDTS